MKIVEWGFFRKNLLYPTFVLIFYLLRTLLEKYMETIVNDSNNSTHSLLYTFYMFLGEFFGSFYMFFFEKIQLKNNKDNNINNNQKNRNTIYSKVFNILLIDGVNKENISITIIFIIFITCFLDSISFSLGISISFLKPKNYSEWPIEHKLKIFQLIFSSILCYLILNIQIYKHHYFTMIFIIFFEIILIALDYFHEIVFIFIIGINILNTFLFSLQEVLEKYLMDIKYLSIFKLLLFQGLIGIGITIVIFLILLNINCVESLNDKHFCNYNESIITINSILDLLQNIKFLIFSLIFIFLCSGANIYRLQTNKMMTPMHRTIADSVLMPIYIIIYKQKNNYEVTIVICFFIILMSLIFCEVIVLKFCDLEKNTYNYIYKRAIDDNKSNRNIYPIVSEIDDIILI